MGINKQVLSVILHEHSYKAITGNYLSIAKHTVNVDDSDINKLFESHGISNERLVEKLSSAPRDRATRHGVGGLFDHDLIGSFSDSDYNSLDISDYEGADIIHDMNTSLPPELVGRFDFIYDGSVMDNVFDPISFVRNCSQLLKPGGRIIHINCAGAVAGGYLCFSPEWFFSYYAVNNFADCKIYATVARDKQYGPHRFNTDLFEWTPHFTRNPEYDYIEGCKSVDGLMHVIVVAEKGTDSTHDRTPIQMQYLDEKCADWREKYDDFCRSPRPIISLGKNRETEVILPLLTDHFRYIGSNF